MEFLCPLCDKKAEVIYCDEDCCGAMPRSVECECGFELNGPWRNEEAIQRQFDTFLINKIKNLAIRYSDLRIEYADLFGWRLSSTFTVDTWIPINKRTNSIEEALNKFMENLDDYE